MPLDFTAIDFETANGSSASACSVGLVKVRDGQIVDRIGWLIQPPPGHDHFVEWNTRIHGIRSTDVLEAPGWVEQLPDLIEFAGADILVAHNAGFDMGVIKSACAATPDGLCKVFDSEVYCFDPPAEQKADAACLAALGLAALDGAAP